MFMVTPTSPSRALCVLNPTAVTRLSSCKAGLLHFLQALGDTGWLHIQRCQSTSPRLGIVRQTVYRIKCAHCQRWGMLGSRIFWQREVLELIHKRVRWKLAAEGLQREKKQRENEKGRDRQMERGREMVENRAETQLYFTVLLYPLLKQPVLLQGSCLASLFLFPCWPLHEQPLLLDSPHTPTSTTTVVLFTHTWDSQFLKKHSLCYVWRSSYIAMVRRKDWAVQEELGS